MGRRARTANLVRQRIEGGGERLWRFEDFRGLPFMAVAQALSRLTRQAIIERLSKGLLPRPTDGVRQESAKPRRTPEACVSTPDGFSIRNRRG